MTRRKRFANDTSKDLRRIRKEFLKPNSKKMNIPIKFFFKKGKWSEQTPKKIYRQQISTWKDAPHHLPSQKCKVEQQWDNTPHQLERPPSKTLTIHVAKDGEQQELPLIAAGNAEVVQALWKNSLAVLLKTEPALTIQSNNCALWHLPRRVFQLCIMSTQKSAHQCL